jgi:hypothetical protein
VGDAGLRWLARLTQLRELNLDRCDEITDQGVKALAGLLQLQRLVLRRCDRVTDGGLAALRRLGQLKTLDLNSLDRVTGAGLRALKGSAAAEALTALDLSDSGLDDEGAAGLCGALRGLRQLDIRRCAHVSDACLAHVAGLPLLESFEKRGCRGITQPSPLGLGGPAID